MNGHHSRTPSLGEQSTQSHAGGRVRLPRWRDYTAFVLSGGGARGALQVGALRALLEHGVEPDVVVGTSAGAWNGAWLAMHPTLAGIETLTQVWRTMHPLQVLLGRENVSNTPQQALVGILMFAAARRVTRGNPSLYGDTGLRQLLGRHYRDMRIESVRLPLRIVATNLTNGTRTVFDSGPIGPALLASSAIPGIFPPVRVGNETYVDGGALDNASLDTALSLGARRLFVLDVGYDASANAAGEWSEARRVNPRRGPLPHALAAVLERTTQVMGRYQLERALERLPRGVEVHVIRPSTPKGGGALDFRSAPFWIDHSYEFAREYLAAHGFAPVAERQPVAVEARG